MSGRVITKRYCTFQHHDGAFSPFLLSFPISIFIVSHALLAVAPTVLGVETIVVILIVIAMVVEVMVIVMIVMMTVIMVV